MKDASADRIRVLDEQVAKKIAAGEVVEGPFSVIKELLENSLDAGADEIEVRVDSSGLKRIFVRDNGSGIHRDDVRLAVQDHATSKIRDVYDIDRVSSFGFRGEALASISSISDFTLITRREGHSGAKLHVRGEKAELGDFEGPAGTTVIVENLFYSVPARKKFLKSERQELRLIRDVFLKAALASHGVSFSLEADGRRQFTFPADASPAARIARIYGEQILDDMFFESTAAEGVLIKAFLSRPHFLKPTRSMQFLYVNGRPVESRYLGFLLSRAYDAAAGPGKHPAAFIFIEIEPESVDVNIHPAKREVKLRDQKGIDSLITALARKALDRAHGFRPDAGGPMNSVSADDGRTQFPARGPAGKGPAIRSYSGWREGQTGPGSSSEERSFFAETSGSAFFKVKAEGGINLLGVAFGTYVLAEKEGALYFIDFHAAHERFIYDEIQAAAGAPETQELIFPAAVELPAGDYRLLLDCAGLLAENGFIIEDFCDNTVTVRAVPVSLSGIDAEGFIKEFVESVKEEREDGAALRISAAALVACHRAKRAGDSLNSGDMALLAEKVFSGAHELRCPHGRPYLVKMEKNEIERMFKRK